ncbi:hypothetical protein [Haladaptatus sp. CMAA 1911]
MLPALEGITQPKDYSYSDCSGSLRVEEAVDERRANAVRRAVMR